MINAQLITILVVFLSVMVGILVNNSRMSDMRAAVDARITDADRTADARLTDANRIADARFAHMDESLARFEKKLDRMEENIMRLLADHDARLRQLEQAKG